MNYCRWYNHVLPLWRHTQRALSSKPKVRAAKFEFDLAEDVSIGIKDGSIIPRFHPGIQKVSPISLPEDLVKAALSILAEFPQKSLEADAEKLSKYIWSRHTPLEGIEYTEKYKDLENTVKLKEIIDPLSPDISEAERKRLLDSRKSKVLQEFKKKVYNWKPVNYNEYMSVVYVIARMAPDFAVLVKVLSEVKKRDSNFSPITMLDFGSGVGSGMWAVDKIWRGVCKEAVCIDPSPDMNTIADRLLRGGNMEDERRVRHGGTFFKQFLPMSDVLKFDLVIASRSLFELPDMEMRLKALDILWRKTAGYLVIIEAGTNAGYKLVLEARDYILGLSTRAEEDAGSVQGHVFSPCSHDKFCPRYLDGSYIPCNFETSYKPFTFQKERALQKDRYSYVVLKKGICNEDDKYPRVLKDPLLRHKHIICQLCTKYGEITDITATKGKHSKECYNVLKHTKMGDLLPIVLPEPKSQTLALNESHSEPELVLDDERDTAKL